MTRFARENTRWIRLLDDYLLSHLHMLDALPEDIHFIIIPEDDPELAYYNVQVANRNIEAKQTPVAVYVHIDQGVPLFRLEVVEDLSSLLVETPVE